MTEGFEENRKVGKLVHCPFCNKDYTRLVHPVIYENMLGITPVRINGLLPTACDECLAKTEEKKE